MLLVEDSNQVNAALQALLTLKFDVSPPETLHAASPYIAQMMNDLYDALIEIERERACSGNARKLEEDRAVEGHTLVLQAVAAHIDNSAGYWQRIQVEQKREFVRLLLAPYTAADATVESIVAQASNRL